jgi:hypothetical protein
MAAEVIYRLELLGKRGSLDPQLAIVDEMLQRWAASVGTGLPIDPEKYDPPNKARPEPLDDETAVIVDRLVMRAPKPFPRLINDWYRSQYPREVIAHRIGVSRSALYVEHRSALWYLKGRLHEAGVDA